MDVRLGLIGAGGICRAHASAACELGVPVTAVADVSETAAREMAKTVGAEKVFSDPADLLALDDVDAVVISVPNRFHKPLAVAALQAGKHVLLEKPMALNVAECREICAAVGQSDRILQMGFVQRYSRTGHAAKQIIDAGRLGEIYHVKANYYRRRGIPGLGGWFTTKALSGGGPLIDLGVHIIDLVFYLMNQPRPTRVSGKVYAKFGPRMKDYVYENMWAGPPRLDGTCDVEDSAHALVRLEGGATLEVNTTWAGNFPDDSVSNLVGLFGDKGGLSFQLGGETVKLATEQDGMNVDMSPKLPPAKPFVEQMRNFTSNIANGCQPHADSRAGLAVQAVLDAIYESSRLDQEVAIEL